MAGCFTVPVALLGLTGFVGFGVGGVGGLGLGLVIGCRSAYQFVVLGMGADPEPMNTVWHRKAERSVVKTYYDAAILTVVDRLEM